MKVYVVYTRDQVYDETSEPLYVASTLEKAKHFVGKLNEWRRAIVNIEEMEVDE